MPGSNTEALLVQSAIALNMVSYSWREKQEVQWKELMTMGNRLIYVEKLYEEHSAGPEL